jgi:hypothetical protein
MSVGDFQKISRIILIVADLVPFDTDPDPAFHFDMDPDPDFQFDTDLSV